MKKQLSYAFLCVLFFTFQNVISQEKTISLTNNFDKIIVSPHIEVVFVKGKAPKIEVQEIMVPIEKLNYEVSNKTLQVYLEDAKTITKHKKYEHDGWKQKKAVYNNTVAKIKITYVNSEVFSLRGEEKITFDSPIDQEKCVIRIYGESEVVIKEANLDELRVAIYGESHLTINSGSIDKQLITAYGSSVVESLNAVAKEAKVTAYGDGVYKINASDKLKVTSYGEAKIVYRGNADLKKGIVIGESTIVNVSK